MDARHSESREEIHGYLPESDVPGEPPDSKVHELKEQVKECEEVEREKGRQLADLNEYWSGKASVLQHAIDKASQDKEKVAQELEALLAKAAKTGPEPPGPTCLHFLDGDLFTLVASTIIVVNIVIMVLEFLDDTYSAEFFWLDQFFMAFYVLELTLKAIYWQVHLLFGPCWLVWWNWLDLVIVVTGVVDMWVMKFLITSGSGSTSFLSYLRALRMARLARILKIIRVFLMSDLSWTDAPRFQSFIMGVIGFNAILIGLEADIPHYFLWYYVEQALLIIFTFELFARLKRDGLKFFYEDWVWNWLDFIIVVGGMFDQWAMPSMSLIQKMMGQTSGGSNNVGQAMMLLRMARLLRILRLVRLVKNIKPLYNLINGIVKAMQGMIWVMVLTVTVLYVCAILGVKLVGHGLLLPNDAPPEVLHTFPAVFDSMFNLFMVMNADLSSMEDLMNYLPVSKYIMMLFVVLTNWAIFSILTAVVSENMTRATEEHEAKVLEQEQAAKLAESERRLREIFAEIDSDGSGYIDQKDFEALAKDEIKKQDLEDATGLDMKTLEDLFAILSENQKSDGQARLDEKKFIESWKTESSAVSERSFMRLEKTVKELEGTFHQKISAMEALLRSAVNGTPCK